VKFYKTAAIGSVAIALNSFKSKEDEIHFLMEESKINQSLFLLGISGES
jgi:hypothetical protein